MADRTFSLSLREHIAMYNPSSFAKACMKRINPTNGIASFERRLCLIASIPSSARVPFHIVSSRSRMIALYKVFDLHIICEMICITSIPTMEIPVLLDKYIVDTRFSILYTRSSSFAFPLIVYSTCISSMVSCPLDIVTSKPYVCNLRRRKDKSWSSVAIKPATPPILTM